MLGLSSSVRDSTSAGKEDGVECPMAAEAKDEDECGWCIGSSKISGEMGLGGPNDWLGGSRKARAWPPDDGRIAPCAVGRDRLPIDALVAM